MGPHRANLLRWVTGIWLVMIASTCGVLLFFTPVQYWRHSDWMVHISLSALIASEAAILVAVDWRRWSIAERVKTIRLTFFGVLMLSLLLGYLTAWGFIFFGVTAFTAVCMSLLLTIFGGWMILRARREQHLD